MAVQREDVIRAMRTFSIEVTPSLADKVGSFAEHLWPGTHVNVTWLAGSDAEETVAVCERLRREGFEPVPHIAARNLESLAHLERMLDALASRARVTEALVIGGGLDTPRGPFHPTMQALDSGLLAHYGINRVGVAGHPEGSPDIAPRALMDALAEKNAWARDTGTAVHLETQFCFDPAGVLAWERRIREAGNRLDIHVGVPGLASLKTLLKFARMVGVGPSMRMLTRQARNLAKLLVVQAPDRLIAGLAPAMANDPDCRITRLHFYPFGGFARTAEWANAVAAGQIVPAGDGFQLGAPLDCAS